MAPAMSASAKGALPSGVIQSVFATQSGDISYGQQSSRGTPRMASLMSFGSWGSGPPGRPCKVAVQRTVYVFSGAMYQPTRLSASVYALANAAFSFRPPLQQRTDN